MSNLLRVSEDNLPVKKQTAYNWHNAKRYPRLIYKVAGLLMFDMEEWEEMARNAKEGDGK